MSGRKVLHTEPAEGTAYAVLRKLALEVYGNRCEWCGEEEGLQFDHVYGDGLRDRQKNRPNAMIRKIAVAGQRQASPALQLLCTNCHRSKGALENTLRAMRSRGLYAEMPTRPVSVKTIQTDATAILARLGI